MIPDERITAELVERPAFYECGLCDLQYRTNRCFGKPLFATPLDYLVRLRCWRDAVQRVRGEGVFHVEKLTEHQEKALRVIRKTMRQRGYPPSVRELCELLGLKSTATVHTYLRTLERKGYIKRTPFRSRALELVENASDVTGAVMVPIVGKVRAGVPVLAVENIEDMVPLPRSFVRSERAFLLRVEGDSMVGAGIQDGDYVLVRQQDTAEDGDIVVALLEDEATVKVFYRERDAIRLEPRNPNFEPITAKSVKILGKVVGLYRSIAQ